MGIIATSFGSPTPFNATWDLIEVTGPASNSSAALTVTAGAGLNASTYSGNSFRLSNTSLSGQKLTRAIIDLGSGLIKDMVFDPAGTAGDLTAKPFTVDANPGVGTISHALSVPRGNGGFEVLTIDFAGGAFDAGETFGFSIDVDPTSIQGVGAPGPGDSGSVSGLELVGATITVQFSDGSSRTASLWSDGSLGGGTATLNQAVAPAPGLAVVGLTPPVSVGSAAQTVRITGPAGATARLLLVEAALFEQPGGGVDIQPFEANCAIARQEITGIVLNGSGSADVPVTMVKTNPDGGLFHLIRRLNGASVLASPTLVVVGGAFVSAVDGPARCRRASNWRAPTPTRSTRRRPSPSACQGNLQVSLGIYDVQGRLVRALVDGVLPAGRHDIAWDGLDRTGRAVGSGTYLYRLQAGDLSATRKITLVK
ncbi:MAG: hypothetical protein IPI48_18090 [bacterium]|nr:hypothetical protein [bacterium]